MYNCYVTSTISVRCRGSFSYSYNDNYNCVLDNRFHVNPTLLAPSHCCACCANSSICNVPINPTFLYGQRQSTLIQFSPSRKLILGGLNQGFSRLPVCDYDRNVRYQKSYNFKERGSVGRRGKLGKGRYGCNVDDAEVILSLLTEEVDECLGVRKRNVGGERNVRRVRSDERFKEVSDSSCKRKVKDNRSGAHKGTSKREKESLKLQFREEDTKQKEDRRQEKRETFTIGESSGTRIRSEGSGCSSYYSLPSSGEFEDDSKAQVKSDEFTGELPSGHKVDYRDSRYDREVTEEVDRHGSCAEHHEVVSEKGDKSNNLYAEASGVDYDLRKKSEKKLDAELIEQTESWKKSRLADFRESGYGKSHSALKQYDDRRETSRSVENTDTTRQQYRNTGQPVDGIPESNMKYKQFAEIPDIHDTVVETNSGSKSQYSGREEGLLTGSSFVQDNAREQLRKYGFVTKEEMYGRNSQKLEYSSKSQESLKSQEIINREDLILRGQSEAKMKNLEDDATLVPKLGDHSKEQYRRSGQQMTTQSGSSGEFQQWTTISNTQNINIQNTSISQKKSDRRIMILPKESQESAETPYQEADRRTGSKKEPEGITSQTDAEVGTSSGRRMSNKQNSSGLKQDEKTKYDVMDERVMHRGAPGEAQRLTKMTSSPDDIAEEAISSSSSLKLGTVHQVGVSPSNNTSSKATARVRMHDEPTGGSQSKNSESGSSTLYMPALEGSPDTQHEVLGEARSGTHDNLLKFLSHEDMIGSAARLQQSSTEFVGEFVDKLRHEKSTSEVHQERVNQQGQSHAQKGHDLHSSGDSEQKDHDPMPVSQGSGAKGPSDEMWDVTDPSIPESRKTESVPEAATTTENSVVKRTGRSMWSVISDIVRLRWAPNSETNNSRSGGKSSSNQSTSSDAWFSGHEHDENNENITQGRGTVGKELTSVGQEGLGVMHAHNQGELSGSKKLKDKMKHVEMPVPVSSVSESVSRLTPKGNMSPTDEKAVAKRRQGTSRIMEPELTLPIAAISMKTSPSGLHEISEPELSVPLPARSLRSPIVHGVAEPESLHPLPSTRMRRSTPVVEEMSEAGEADASGSGMALSRQPGSTSVTEISISEGKPGGMKQKKLQRTTQVLKDRFDEWEEAHMLETEQRKNDEMFMREALLEAKKAADVWEVPVGAVLVQHGKIIARGHNLVEELRDSTAHAEMICIREASSMLRSWRLSETTLYVTLEPCPMCAGAILQARIDTIVWGAPNKLLGADGSWIRLFPSGGEGHSRSEPTVEAPAPVHPFHPNVKLRRGVLASECADAMQQFFQLRRKKRDEKPELPTPATPPSCLPISSRPSKLLTKMHDAFHIMFCL